MRGAVFTALLLVPLLAGCATTTPHSAAPTTTTSAPAAGTGAAAPAARGVGDWIEGEYLDARLIAATVTTREYSHPAKSGNPAYVEHLTWHNATMEIVAKNGTAVMMLGLWPAIPPQGAAYTANWTRVLSDRGAGVVGDPHEGILIRGGAAEFFFYMIHNDDGMERHEALVYRWALPT